MTTTRPIFRDDRGASIISAAARNNVPAVYTASDFARDGGLLSYGVDLADLYRRAATYVAGMECSSALGQESRSTVGLGPPGARHDTLSYAITA
jgi:hypothetical protein